MTYAVFTARRYASVMYAVVVCPSVCLPVCHKPVLYQMAKRGITKTLPRDSSGILVFCCQRSRQNSNEVTPTGAPNAGGMC